MIATATNRVNALDSYGVAASDPNDPMQVIRAAGGDFGLEKVSMRNLGFENANDDLHCVRRMDTGAIIGQVGNDYTTLSNEEFFVPLAKALIENTGARIERFAMLNGGNRAFMRLKWDENIQVGDAKIGDIVGRRATLTTGHDGKFAAKLLLQMLRLECLNGMVIPVGMSDFSVVHSIGGHSQLADIVKMVPRLDEYTNNFTAASNVLINTPVDAKGDAARKIIANVVDVNSKAGKTKTGEDNAATGRINRVVELFDGGQPGANRAALKNTAWGLFNSITDFEQYGRPVDNVRRFKSLLPGGSANRNVVKAWESTVDGLDLRAAIAEAVSRN